MTSINKTAVLIAAAGKGTRSGLNYPKTLFKIEGKSILSRIFEVVSTIDLNPTVVASPSGEIMIKKHLNSLDLTGEVVIQEHPLGMGDAVLKMLSAQAYQGASDVLLLWGDLPFIQKSTLEQTIEAHYKNNNDFTFPTLYSDSAYTIVNRDSQKAVSGIIETRELPNHDIGPGERDMGMFIFKKNLIFNLLNEDLPTKYSNQTNEHGFLYIIEHLVSRGRRVEALNIATKLDSISLNKMEDLTNYN